MFSDKEIEKLDQEVEELANKILEYEQIIAEIDQHLDKIIENLDKIKDKKIQMLILGAIITKTALNTRLDIGSVIGTIESTKLELWLLARMSDPIAKGILLNHLKYKKQNA